MTPTLATSCAALPPEGAVPPAAWQSQFRGRGLHESAEGQTPTLRTLFMTTFQDSPWHA